MKELSLHILDIVQNSIGAGAKNVSILIDEDVSKDKLVITVKDNGRGMDKETVEKIKDPFFTSRTTRRVGLGIPMFFESARRCGGGLVIHSEIGKGTEVTAEFILSHIDRAPIGNMWDTMTGLIICNEDVEFEYNHKYSGRCFQFKTSEIKEILDGVPISSPEVVEWISGYIKEGINKLYGGVE